MLKPKTSIRNQTVTDVRKLVQCVSNVVLHHSIARMRTKTIKDHISDSSLCLVSLVLSVLLVPEQHVFIWRPRFGNPLERFVPRERPGSLQLEVQSEIQLIINPPPGTPVKKNPKQYGPGWANDLEGLHPNTEDFPAGHLEWSTDWKFIISDRDDATKHWNTDSPRSPGCSVSVLAEPQTRAFYYGWSVTSVSRQGWK